MDLAEGGPLRPLLLPAVQHQLMEMWGAVNRSWQPETVLDGLDHLQDLQKKNSYNQVRKSGNGIVINTIGLMVIWINSLKERVCDF